jgi:alanine racemase
VSRHAEVQVDLGAIAHNVSVLRARAGAARLCAVVKADGYGHGMVEVSRTAVAAGADMLAVALVEEGAVLRAAGVSVPILVLSEPPADTLAAAWDLSLTPTLYHRAALRAAARAVPRGSRWGVHLKVDTGMHRVGVRPEELVDLAADVLASPELVLDGVFTHLAVADEPDRAENVLQAVRFDAVLAELRARGIDPGTVHMANSAGLLAHPGARRDLVRVGIALYGIPPAPGLDGGVDLRPALRVVTEVSHVSTVAKGEGVSYGLRHHFDRDTVVATVPVGYADGITRRLGLCGGEVLIGGTRRPIRGVVTMDQLVVEVGPVGAADEVAVGDEVVIIGAQQGPAGCDELTAWDWAERVGTIAYEVVCGLSPRLPRAYR